MEWKFTEINLGIVALESRTASFANALLRKRVKKSKTKGSPFRSRRYAQAGTPTVQCAIGNCVVGEPVENRAQHKRYEAQVKGLSPSIFLI